MPIGVVDKVWFRFANFLLKISIHLCYDNHIVLQ